jgi:hypothetical protein
MFRRLNGVTAGVLCALALALSPMPKAHAAPQVMIAY